jgi:hypothetical protein
VLTNFTNLGEGGKGREREGRGKGEGREREGSGKGREREGRGKGEGREKEGRRKGEEGRTGKISKNTHVKKIKVGGIAQAFLATSKNNESIFGTPRVWAREHIASGRWRSSGNFEILPFLGFLNDINFRGRGRGRERGRVRVRVRGRGRRRGRGRGRGRGGTQRWWEGWRAGERSRGNGFTQVKSGYNINFCFVL